MRREMESAKQHWTDRIGEYGPPSVLVTGRTQGPGKLLEMASVLVKFRNLVKKVVESAAIPVTIYAVVR